MYSYNSNAFKSPSLLNSLLPASCIAEMKPTSTAPRVGLYKAGRMGDLCTSFVSTLYLAGDHFLL